MPYKDVDKRRQYLKEWTALNKEKAKKYAYDYRERHPDRKMLKASKANAKARGIEHSISVEDIEIPLLCPYLGLELSAKVQSGHEACTMSLDRIDNSKGYVPGNVQVISNLANLMKSFATEEQLITFAKNVLKIHDKAS